MAQRRWAAFAAVAAVAVTTVAALPLPPLSQAGDAITITREPAAPADGAVSFAGRAVAADSRVRVSDQPVAGADMYVLDAYALVVHPRAPLLDLDRAAADGLLSTGASATLDAALGGHVQLMVDTSSVAWLERAYPAAARLTLTGSTAEVRAAVASDLLLVGLISVDSLDLTVRALTVAGYDPYRDPDSADPLADARWIEDDPDGAVAARLGWDAGDDPIGVLGAGEMIPARCVTERAAADPRGYDAIYDGTRTLIQAADVAVFNWEPAVVDAGPTPCTQTFNLSTSPEAAQAAARAGADVALVIGNHTGDCWTDCAYTEAILETLEHLRATGMRTAGGGEDLAAARVPAVLDVAGASVAVLGYDEVSAQHYGAREDTPGTSPSDLEAIAEDVTAAAASAEIVVVGFSWGVEYTATPTTYQREAARVAIEAGADLVLGNHPHWVQATEAGEATFVAYGLGNFIFDQDWSVETTQGVVLEAGFRNGRLIGIRLRPTAILDELETVLLDPLGDEARAIMLRIWEATDALG